MAEKLITVLYIEDNPADIRFLEEILKEDDEVAFKLVALNNLASGIEYLREQEADIILLDLMLPDSNGLDTLRKLRTLASTIPVIVLSGLDDEAICIQAVKEGAFDYLVKWKIDNRFIVRALRYTLERFRLQLELEKTRERVRLERERAENIRNYKHYLALVKDVGEDAPLSADALIAGYFNKYKDLVLRYVRALRIQEERPGEEIREFAHNLVAANFKARDVVRLHLQVLNEFSQRAMPNEERAFSNDARLVLVELLGVMMDILANLVKQ